MRAQENQWLIAKQQREYCRGRSVCDGGYAGMTMLHGRGEARHKKPGPGYPGPGFSRNSTTPVA